MAKKKENVTEEIKVQESTVKAPVKKAAAKKVKESEAKTQSDADIENEEALKAQELAEKFDEKCNGLLAIAKKKKNVLDYQEIMNYFLDTDFEADKMEKVFEFLEKNNVDVKMSEDVEEDDDIILDDEDEIDIEKIDLSVPDGIGLDDPVRMYLKEIGKVPLLSAEEEIELAKNMEAGAVAKEKIAILKSREENATEEELAEIKEEINRAIFKLYGLDDEEIAVIRKRLEA